MNFFTRLSLSTLSILALLAAPGCLIDNKIGSNPDDESTGDGDASASTDGVGTTSGGNSEPGDPTATATSATSGQTEPEETTGAAEVKPCVELETVHALDEQTPGGFSAEQVLTGKLGPRAATLQFAAEPLSLSDQWKSKAFPLTVELRHEGGQVRWIDSIPNPDYMDPDEGIGPGEECISRMLVDVELDFVTEAGEFAEHRAATLEATTIEFASLTVELTPDVMGTFDHTTLYSDPAWMSESVWVYAAWSGALAGGDLNNQVTFDGFFGAGIIARWGDDILPPDAGP